MIRFRAQVFTSLRVWVLAGHRAKPFTAASVQLLSAHPYHPGPWNAHGMAEREKDGEPACACTPATALIYCCSWTPAAAPETTLACITLDFVASFVAKP